MKVVFSRKGIDSDAGGGASPVFADGQFLSLPIPYTSGVGYEEIISEIPGIEYGPLIENLTPMRRNQFAHLDPDLRYGARPVRNEGWRPAFGQSGSALSHLRKNGVKEGDLFLFYGRFQPVVGPPWKYVRHSDYKYGDFQAVWGWLRVGSIVDLDHRQPPRGNADHPHANGDYRQGNTLYIAQERLDLPGFDGITGGGTLPSLKHLTVKGSSASQWALPREWLTKQRQEHVGDTGEHPELLDWINYCLADLRSQLPAAAIRDAF